MSLLEAGAKIPFWTNFNYPFIPCPNENHPYFKYICLIDERKLEDRSPADTFPSSVNYGAIFELLIKHRECVINKEMKAAECFRTLDTSLGWADIIFPSVCMTTAIHGGKLDLAQFLFDNGAVATPTIRTHAGKLVPFFEILRTIPHETWPVCRDNFKETFQPKYLDLTRSSDGDFKYDKDWVKLLLKNGATDLKYIYAVCVCFLVFNSKRYKSLNR